MASLLRAETVRLSSLGGCTAAFSPGPSPRAERQKAKRGLRPEDRDPRLDSEPEGRGGAASEMLLGSFRLFLATRRVQPGGAP